MPSQGVSQPSCADDGHRATEARERRHAIAGVADESDAPVRPRRHPDLADTIKIEVVVLAHTSEHVGHFPPQTGKMLPDQATLLILVPVIVFDLAGRAEPEADIRAIVIAVQHRHPPRNGKKLRAVRFEQSGVWHDFEVEIPAHEVGELLTIAEHELARIGAVSIATTYQCEFLLAAVAERRRHRLRTLRDRHDRAVEP